MGFLKSIVSFFTTPGFWISALLTFAVIAIFQFYASPFGRGQVVSNQIPGLAMMSSGAFLLIYLLGWGFLKEKWPFLQQNEQERELWDLQPKGHTTENKGPAATTPDPKSPEDFLVSVLKGYWFEIQEKEGNELRQPKRHD